jgi:hypothetical protein
VEQRNGELLTDTNYENCYAEALAIVRGKYGDVGPPYRKENGERVCDVESLQADDLMIFMLAWGSEISYPIAG